MKIGIEIYSNPIQGLTQKDIIKERLFQIKSSLATRDVVVFFVESNFRVEQFRLSILIC